MSHRIDSLRDLEIATCNDGHAPVIFVAHAVTAVRGGSPPTGRQALEGGCSACAATKHAEEGNASLREWVKAPEVGE